MFMSCPAHLDADGADGAARCGLPARVQWRYVIDSTVGPIESAAIRCLSGHFFNGPIEFLVYDRQPLATSAPA